LKEYKVVLSIQAKEDYKRIISYIKNKLLEPNIAEIYAELIKDEFNILKYNPQKFAIIDYDLLKKYKFRNTKRQISCCNRSFWFRKIIIGF